MANWPHRLDHVGIPVRDMRRARDFYTAALAPLGIELLGGSDAHAAFGISHMPYLTLRLSMATPTPVHLAFSADNRAQVDAFYYAAVAAGGADHGMPGLRPLYHAHYYGAFVLDPDGHNIEVVRHDPD